MSRLNRALAATAMAVAAAGGGLLSAAAGATPAGAAPAASCLPSDGTQPPAPPGSHGERLYDVAVVAACDVWAVGSSAAADGKDQLLIEHWTGGGSWTAVTIPGPDAGRSAQLTSVSAVSATDVWAAGEYTDGGHATPLILHWDGSTWAPQAIGTGDTTYAVTALPSGEAWAVGGGTILHRDGGGWAPATLPSDPDLAHLFLFGVTATSASNAWAVGTITSTETPVILRWDGTSWTRDRTVPDGSASLTGISAVSATDAWAVGNTFSNRGEAPLTLHWDGTSWKTIASPDPGTGDLANDALRDVTAISASNAWAAGFYTAPDGRSLLLHWDGMNWAQVPTPHPGTFGNLLGVAAGPASTIWTVGVTLDSTSVERSIAWGFGPVPNVIGDTISAATSALTAAGLTVSSTQNTTTNCTPGPTSQVVSTDPAAGQQVPFGQAVTLTVCGAVVINPTVTVPDVTGEDDNTARSDITSAGLTVGTITLKTSCTIPRGQVISQSPAGGTTAAFGARVNLTEATRSGPAVRQITPHACTQ